jgi:uncharacterized damage-inducible protein DinB
MSLSQHFGMLATYNSWANGRIYNAAAALPDGHLKEDRGAFFGSVHGTLNHLLATDRIWLKRMTGQGTAPDRLDVILHDDLPDLHAARLQEDERLIVWIGALGEEDLETVVRYGPITSPVPVTQTLVTILFHLFNHQTHHRGQVHALLTAIGGRDAAPSLDLVVFQRETGWGIRI